MGNVHLGKKRSEFVAFLKLSTGAYGYHLDKKSLEPFLKRYVMKTSEFRGLKSHF